MKWGKPSTEEDAQLKEAVEKQGKDGGVAVAKLVLCVTDKQCRQRWINAVDPANRKRTSKWSTEEDAKLTEAAKKHDNDWVAVAAMIPGRMNTQCCKHFRTLNR